ncbi:MAG: chemotaxis protein CheA [Clostridium sp.]|uniref:chemotaxis protein CheA n=1 Tax=Clostridium sp. TaxID=1506 RepID=UPI003F3C0361
MDTSQYMTMFLEESMDNLQTLSESLLELEKSPEDVEILNQIFRVAHTIKGMAATMGFTDIAELTHKMEDVLSDFRDGKMKVTPIVVTVLFDCLDTLEKMIDIVREEGEGTIEIKDIIKRLEEVKNVTDSKEEVEKIEEKSIEESNLVLNEYDLSIIKQAVERGYNALELKIVLSENTLLKSARAFLIFQDLEEKGEIIKSNPSTEKIENEEFEFTIEIIILTTSKKEEIEKLVENISEVEKIYVKSLDFQNEEEKKPIEEIKEKKIEEKPKKEEPKKKEEKKAKAKKVHQSVRVDLEKIDNLMNMVSELVIYRTRLEQIVIDNKESELNETLEQVGRTTSDLQDLVMKIRMLPLDVVFNRFPRMIRDVSLELKKEVNFIIEGADTELDRTVIDEIGEPLIHLLRNAIDHGIESKEERVQKGKNPIGTIKLQAYQEGTKALIKVTDDGAGINVDKVRKKAERVGISTDGMSEQDIKNLIFAQGFSTNEVVTDISGRGVGMDVVKTKIASLGGTVELTSEEGVGSTFIIRLPLTLQIIQALLVNVGDETFAISLGFIDRVIGYDKENIKKTNGKEVIVYRDRVIPLVRLNEKLNIESKEGKKKFVIIVNAGERTFGLLVDSLIGQQEIVIKPLGRTLKGLNEYIGATILGNGLVTLILDVGVLY